MIETVTPSQTKWKQWHISVTSQWSFTTTTFELNNLLKQINELKPDQVKERWTLRLVIYNEIRLW